MSGQLQRRGIESHRQADTTDLDVNRHGRGANFVAMTGFVPVVFMNSPKNSSELPKPYTCHHGTSGVAHSRKKLMIEPLMGDCYCLVWRVHLKRRSLASMPTSAVSTKVIPSSTSA